MRRTLLVLGLILAVATLVSAAPFKIALSNSFMGNDWRQEMEKVAQEVAKKDFFLKQATLTIINCDNSPEAQSDSIDSLVKQGYNAILVDASSPTALNPAIDRAVAAGVVIISFDQVVTHAAAWKIETDFNKVPRIQALYIAKAIGGKGDIVVDRGLPGAPISKQLEDGARAVFKQYPGIKILDSQPAYWDTQKGLQIMENYLQKYKKLDAVWAQDDDVLIGVLQAYKESKRNDIKLFLGGAGSKIMIKKVMDGDPLVKADVTYPPSMVATGISLAVKGIKNQALDGFYQKKIPSKIILASELITKENARGYYEPDSIF